MGKKHDIDKNDKDLFRSAMRDVKPLQNTKIAPKAYPIKKSSKKDLDTNPNPLNLMDNEHFMAVSGDDVLEYHTSGLQHKVLRKLRRGQYNTEAILDLHGMRVIEAQQALNYFIINCIKKGARHVLIIHGKGHGTNKPALKNKLNQWLRQIKYVLAFCSATPQQGNTGAVYVLLKGENKSDI